MIAASLCLLIELHNDHLQGKQRLVDVLSFADGLLVIVSCLVDAFRTSQIDNVKLSNRARVFAHLLRVDFNDEDTMRTSRRVVLGRFGHNTIGIADEEQVQSILFIFSSMHRQILEVEATVLVLLHLDLW